MQENNKPYLLYKILPSDMKTPVAALAAIGKKSPYHFLLESVENGANKGRYSIVGLLPDVIWKCYKGKVTMEENGREIKTDGDAFSSLRELIGRSAIDFPENVPGAASGVFGYMGYDMVRLMENIGADDKPDPINIPDSIFIRPQVVIVFDSVKDQLGIYAPVRGGDEKKPKKLIEEIISLLEKPVKSGFKNFSVESKTKSAWEEEGLAYENAVNKAKEYILAGDIFQVVLSERRSVKLEKNISGFAVYRSLRNLNPSPYLFYLNMDNFSIVGSSPEILVKVEKGGVTIRPLAGTRKRGSTQMEDIALEKELLADEKEISEHLMLLDLGRNDVGRVAEKASVKVTEQMMIERYTHVMHIVSNVEGKLKKGLDSLDALIAGFPAGTVSGAPKIRAMQIINELEKERRSFYGGCVGYFSGNGDMDSCITLRTCLVKDGILYSQAGAGIVADSVPKNEYAECVNKAKSIMVAAELAGKYKL